MNQCGSRAGPQDFGEQRDRAESSWSVGSWDAPLAPVPSCGGSGCSAPMGPGGAVFTPYGAMRPCPMQPAMQMGFSMPGQYAGSGPGSSCDATAFTAFGHGAFPQWQFGCPMPTPFPCSSSAQAGGSEVRAAYPCQGMGQPFAFMPVPVAPFYGAACAPNGPTSFWP